LPNRQKRWMYAVWLLLICAFAILHGLHLRADFPNHSPWANDWAKYTDEGWYGNAAIRAHLFGNWYLPGDFNPAPAVPVWPFLEWLLFFATGVTVEAARGLAVALFFANLLLSYKLLCAQGPRWAALFALTLLVTSPFLYCFSRLAILEPLLTTLTLGALNLAVRLTRWKHPARIAAVIGVLFTLMMLTKSTAVFLLPALGWAIVQPFWRSWRLALRCAVAAASCSVLSFGLWIVFVVHMGLLADYRYFFFVNEYPKPPQAYWPLLSLWWSVHGGLWVDHILIPLAGVVVVGALVAVRTKFGRRLLADPAFGASVLAVVGYIFFMTVQNHPQPRYFAVIAVFCFFIVAEGSAALLAQTGRARQLGMGLVALGLIAATTNAAWTFSYATHPEYTFVEAAQRLTRYIDDHPNGNRLLVSVSGDEITLLTHLPSLCDDFGTKDLPDKLAAYQPGWFATWNDLDPGTLADIHTHFALEEVGRFHALDDPDRNVLVLFKLHPLPNGMVRDEGDENLQIPLPGDKIDIDVE